MNRQIFMITDGKPSTIREYGRLNNNPFGLDPRIVNRPLEEAAYCRRKRITITTLMLATDAPLLGWLPLLDLSLSSPHASLRLPREHPQP